MIEFLTEIRNRLGYAPPSIRPGKVVRFSTCDRKGDKSGWARLFDDGAGGVFGCWRSGITETWHPKKEQRTDAERQAWAEAIRQNKEKSRLEIEKLRSECRKKSAELWDRGRAIDVSHEYLVKKGLTPHAAKQLRNLLMIPVRGIDGTLRGLQFVSENGHKNFKSGTEISGSYCGIGQPVNDTLLICEGWATGCSLREAAGHAVAVGFNAGNILQVCKELRKKYPAWRLVVCADDDHETPGNPGLTKAREAALAVGGLLAVPDFSGLKRGPKHTDFNDLACLDGLDRVQRCIEQAQPVLAETTSPAPSPDTDTTKDHLLFDSPIAPEIPAAIFPSWLGDMIAATSRSAQTPSGLAAMMGLSVVATAVAKRFEIGPFPQGYREPLNIWTATALPPGSRKTAIVSALTDPLVEWEKSEADRLGPEIKKVRAKRHALEKKREKLLKDSAISDSEEKLQVILDKINGLDSEMPDEIRAPRLWTADSTPERLQGLLVEHGERMAFLSDEGGIFQVMSGLYSHGMANLDVFLQGHAGHPTRVDRQGRSVHLDSPALSFGLAIQPSIVAELGGSKKGFRGNGTLARFLFCMPKSNIGERDVRAVYQIPEEISARYRRGLLNLLSIHREIREGKEVARRLWLSQAALDCWHDFAAMIEARQGTGGDLEVIQDWTGKCPGAVLRIAGLFHLVEHGSNPPEQVGLSTIERAVELGQLLIQHAKITFGTMSGGGAIDDARDIWEWVLEQKLTRFKRGEIYRKFKGRFTGDKERLEKALWEIEERGIAAPVSEKTPGRSATVYVVNKSLWGRLQADGGLEP